MSSAFRNTKFASYRLVGYFSGSINFFTNFINVVVILAGGWMITKGELRLSDFVAFLLYVNIFMRPVFRLTILAEVYQRGMAGFHRFEEIMHTAPSITDPPHPLALAHVKGDIDFHDLSFGYEPDRLILHHLNFAILAGKTVAFVGETGAGKSTLVSLLLRFYEPTEGTITLDGHNLNEFAQQDLRRKIGIVQQDVFLFGDTIAENIAYGREGASMDEIRQAAKLAAADEFIESLPNGYDTKVGERGVKLSGGQKQRIAIARVFLKNPPVVIFDEATSALDTQTEKMVQATLDDLARNRTTIIIAHRLSTVRNADCIYVLDHGRLLESGNHEELIRKKGKRGAMNLFIKSAPLHLRVQMNDSTEWRMKNQWLAMDLFYNEGSLCCFNEQPYEKALENFYPNLCDTITTRINRLFPQIKTTTQVSHDEAVAYFTVCGN